MEIKYLLMLFLILLVIVILGSALINKLVDLERKIARVEEKVDIYKRQNESLMKIMNVRFVKKEEEDDN